MGNKSLKIARGLTLRVLITASLLCISAVQAEVVGQSSDELLVTKRATQDKLVHPQQFEFSIADFRYLVLSNGDGVRTDSRNNSSAFALPLADGYDIERLTSDNNDNGQDRSYYQSPVLIICF